MVNEYFLVMKKVSPESAKILSLRKYALSINSKSESITLECRDFNSKCSNQLKSIKKEIVNFEKSIFKEIEDVKITSVQIDDQIEYLRLLKDLAVKISSLSHSIEEYSLLKDSELERYSKNMYDISDGTNEALFLLNLKINTLMPSHLRPEFEKVWKGFVLPIEQNVLRKNDKEFLLSHLERFNIDWNSFHKNITKGNFDLPKSKTLYSDIIHNRWNQILKIILRK